MTVEHTKLDDVVEALRPAGARWVVGVVAAAWLAIGAGDWAMRFRWFRWQDSIVSRGAMTSEALSAPMQKRENPEHRGGDLTRLVNIASFARAFEQVRPATVDWTDELGYRNEPPVTGRSYRIVVTGASYMNTGFPMTNMFSARLSAVGGVPVYNHAIAGHGPFMGPLKYLENKHFAEHPPRVLVWGIAEREIGGVPFAGFVYQLVHRQRAQVVDAGRASVAWQALTPESLKTSLPNTSLLAQYGERAWNRLRYELFRQITPDVAVSAEDVEGAPFLFYAPAVTALKWSPQQRDADKVAWALGHFRDACRAKGTELVILLIPDKEQVYRDLLPPRLNSPSSPIPPSCLYDVERALQAAGIPVVNLLPDFEREAARGVFLYWRDDTHWNDRAMAMAAERLWRAVEPLLTASAGEVP
jgi:hypothetical protein